MGISCLLRLKRFLSVTCLDVRWQTVPSVFNYSLLNVDSTIVDLSYRMVPYQIISNMFLFKAHEAEASALSCIDVFQNDRIYDFSELIEVLFQLFVGEFEVKASDENFRLWILELNLLTSFVVFDVLLFTYYVGIGFLDLLAACCCNRLISLVRLQTVLACSSFLVVVRRFYIDSFFEYEMTCAFVLIYDCLFLLLGLLFISEAQ